MYTFMLYRYIYIMKRKTKICF